MEKSILGRVAQAGIEAGGASRLQRELFIEDNMLTKYRVEKELKKSWKKELCYVINWRG